MPALFPENFTRLHTGEEIIRRKSIEAIEASDAFSAHAHVLERATDLIEFFSRQHASQNEDQLTVQLLGIRLFNGVASALSLLLSGYYQTSALQQRDLLETIFLLDYFWTDQTLICKWRMSDQANRLKFFKPVKVREALDDRDGFTERKRKAAYNLLCELAGHANFGGFRMLRPVAGGDAHCGPFFAEASLKATLEELTKLSVQAAGIFVLFFPVRAKAGYQISLAFMEAQGAWVEKFYSKPFDRRQIEEMKARLAQVVSRS